MFNLLLDVRDNDSFARSHQTESSRSLHSFFFLSLSVFWVAWCTAGCGTARMRSFIKLLDVQESTAREVAAARIIVGRLPRPQRGARRWMVQVLGCVVAVPCGGGGGEHTHGI